MCLEAPRSAWGLESGIVGGVMEVGEDGARFIEKTDDIVLADVS